MISLYFIFYCTTFWQWKALANQMLFTIILLSQIHVAKQLIQLLTSV